MHLATHIAKLISIVCRWECTEPLEYNLQNKWSDDHGLGQGNILYLDNLRSQGKYSVPVAGRKHNSLRKAMLEQHQAQQQSTRVQQIQNGQPEKQNPPTTACPMRKMKKQVLKRDVISHGQSSTFAVWIHKKIA